VKFSYCLPWVPETNYAKIDVQHFIEWRLVACKSVASCPWRESDDRNKIEIVSINLFRIAFEIFNLHNGIK